jgi:opacity protein-like surface antigen
MKALFICVVSGICACSHAGAARWNQQEYLVSEMPATDTTTNRPVYAMVQNDRGAIIFPSSPQARSGVVMSKDDQVAFNALRSGSQYGDAFASGKAEILWEALTDDARRERKDLGSLRKLVDGTLSQLGSETRVTGEYVVGTATNGIAYLRYSEYANAPKGMVLEFRFATDSTTRLAGLAVYRPETRPIAVKIGEGLNAAR